MTASSSCAPPSAMFISAFLTVVDGARYALQIDGCAKERGFLLDLLSA
jgi:hypothetical protein